MNKRTPILILTWMLLAMSLSAQGERIREALYHRTPSQGLDASERLMEIDAMSYSQVLRYLGRESSDSIQNNNLESLVGYVKRQGCPSQLSESEWLAARNAVINYLVSRKESSGYVYGELIAIADDCSNGIYIRNYVIQYIPKIYNEVREESMVKKLIDYAKSSELKIKSAGFQSLTNVKDGINGEDLQIVSDLAFLAYSDPSAPPYLRVAAMHCAYSLNDRRVMDFAKEMSGSDCHIGVVAGYMIKNEKNR